MKKQFKFVAAAAVAATMALSLVGCASGGASAGKDKVFFLLPNTQTTRFENRDKPAFIDAMKKYAPNAEVTTVNAEGDAAKQQQQVEDAITQGAKVIVFTAADSNLAAGSLEAADKAKVPVVLYDHDAKGGPVTAHVVFDSLAVGQAQGKRAAELINAMPGDGLKIARIMGNPGEFGTEQYKKGQDESLQPLIDSGKIKVVCEKNIVNWDPVAGQAYMEDCLAKNNNKLDLIVSMNDGLAGGAVAALTTQKLQGKIKVTGGQDANLDAITRVAAGLQDSSVFKNLALEADGAAQIVASLLSGKGVPSNLINGKVNNEFMDVPAMFLPVENITIDNIGVLVDAKVWTWAEICKGIETVEVCKANL